MTASRTFRLVVTAILAAFAPQASSGQCVVADYFNAGNINLALLSPSASNPFPSSSFRNTVFNGGRNTWNSSECNVLDDFTGFAFPTFETTYGDRTITVKYFTAGQDIGDECGSFTPTGGGNATISIWEKIYIPGVGETACGDANALAKVLAHELGHYLGLDDVSSSCGNLMAADVWSPSTGSWIRGTLSAAECQMADLSNITEHEAYCAEREDPERCRDCDMGQCGGGNSPILLDLSGKAGFRFTSLAQGVRFDIDADGRDEQVAWVSPGGNDAFLVRDLNGNGVVDNGAELFGDATVLQSGNLAPFGYVALRELDRPSQLGNGDGVLSASDFHFWQLLVWRDRDADGETDPGELQSLREAGVHQLLVNWTFSDERDRFGNELRFWSAFRGTDGERATVDVFFLFEP